MEDKIINTTEEYSTMTVSLKDGTKIPVKAKTIYTKWASSRIDCEVQILEPINGSANLQK